MKKTLLLCGALLALSATAAVAAENKLAWDNCRGGGGANVKTSACNVNTGSNTMVASATAPAGVDMWTAFEAEFLFDFQGNQPAWWQLRNQTGQSGQCRNGAISANAIGAGTTGCEDVYGGNGSGGIGTYQNGANFGAPQGGPQPDKARLLIVFAVPTGSEVALTPETEYFVAKVVITNAKTVGTGNCAGCSAPACISLTNVKFVQPAGAPGGDQSIGRGLNSDVAWQANGLSECAVSTTRKTWSSVKGLYR